MAGYSGTPLVKKLGIKEGHRLAFPGAPEGFREVLGEIPAGAEVRERTRGPLDVIVFFTKSHAELRKRLPSMRRAMDPAAGLWIAWPKRGSASRPTSPRTSRETSATPTPWSTTRSAPSTTPGRGCAS